MTQKKYAHFLPIISELKKLPNLINDIKIKEFNTNESINLKKISFFKFFLNTKKIYNNPPANPPWLESPLNPINW